VYQDSTTHVCPYLRIAQDKTATFQEPTPVHRCYATVESFSPSAVQQSSCCFNSAIFARCPYYVAARGGTPEPVGVTVRPQRRDTWLAQMSRLFSFGKKKRRRIYYT
jgi:hypothetical protein